MNPFNKSQTQFVLRRGVPCFAALAFLFWILAWACLNERFSSGGYADLYQNSASFAVQSHPLDLKFPLLGEFPPFTEAWGIQWPFYMAVKSFIFQVIPYNLSTIFLLGLTITTTTAVLGYLTVRRMTGGVWLASLTALALLSDRNLMFHIAAGRSEPLVCLLFLCMLDQARRIAANGGKGACLGFLLPFLLLPGMHPFGLMVTGGLVLLHLVFFKRLYPGGGRALFWGPPVSYAAGVGLLVLWFFLQPAAWEQMRINLQVQEAIYQTATRFTFFVPFITELPLGSGYLLWGGALAGGVFVAGSACLVLFGKDIRKRLSPDLFLAASIVCSLPVIGLIFRVDNFYHFAVGTSAAVYLIFGLAHHGRAIPETTGLGGLRDTGAGRCSRPSPCRHGSCSSSEKPDIPTSKPSAGSSCRNTPVRGESIFPPKSSTKRWRHRLKNSGFSAFRYRCSRTCARIMRTMRSATSNRETS